MSTWPEDHPNIRFKFSKEFIEASLFDLGEDKGKVKKG